ncbi:MAG: SDR family NAD(P)-dependent oxidoreductase [Steroidobacteraceae bacterium]
MPQPSKFRDRLAGRVALVTGAGSQTDGIGTGRAIATVFAGEGARVCLVDQDPVRAELTRRTIEAAGGDGFVFAGDIADSAVCAAAVAATVARYGSLDILVNNVGVSGGGGELWDLDEAQWARMVDLNFKTCVLMTKHAMRPLVASGRGAIVNIASTAALLASGGNYAYGPAKAAMIAFSRDVAVTYGRRGVRSNVVAPGHIFTPHVEGFFDAAAREVRRKVAPLGVPGDAWDVAAASLFLASEEARFITGICLAVDGGVTHTMQLTAHRFIEE